MLTTIANENNFVYKFTTIYIFYLNNNDKYIIIKPKIKSNPTCKNTKKRDRNDRIENRSRTI